MTIINVESNTDSLNLNRAERNVAAVNPTRPRRVSPPFHPSWLERMLETRFYERCNNHEKKDTTCFCTDCGGRAFCESCHKTASNPHHKHKVIQVYKASRQIAVRKKDLQGLMETKKLHPFKINSYDIYYLHRRVHEGKGSSHADIINGSCKNTCEVCGWSLKLEGFPFCSLQCQQTRRPSDQQNDDRMETMTEELITRSEMVEKPGIQKVPNPKKRSRKGIPRRSPLTFVLDLNIYPSLDI